MLCEIVGGFLADFWDGQCVQPAGKRHRACALAGFEKLGGVFFAKDARLFVGAEVECAEWFEL